MTPAEIEAELERLHAAGFAWALACSDRNREDALDVLQSSYLKVLDGHARFEGRSSFKTFLFGVIRKTSRELRRRNAFRHLWLARWGRGENSASREGGAEERLTLLDALASLPRRQREVLELVFYIGLTVEEAAESLAISVGTARVHYDRAKKRLGRVLSARHSA